MTTDSTAALFLMLGQVADQTVTKLDDVVPKESLLLSHEYDLATLMPGAVRSATDAAYVYRLLFVFETYLRDLVVEVLSNDGAESDWWDKVPGDVQNDVSKIEQTEEMKSWMSLGSRDKSALLTLPQLLKIIDEKWKLGFDELVRDKSLIYEARMLTHLRNTICHMTTISDEETSRIKQTIRDWFRVVAP